MRHDVVKASVRNHVSSDVNAHKKLNESAYWSVNKHKTTNREFQCSGPMECALPNSKTGFFYECVTQKFYECNPDKNLFVEDDNVEEDETLEPFDVSGSCMGRMMELSSELMSFSIGGPRLFINNAIVETLKNGHKAIMHQIILLKYIEIVVEFIGHHGFTVSMKALITQKKSFFNRQQDDQLEEMFQDANKYGYVATQMTHLPQLPSYDPGNIMSYVPLYNG